MNTKPLEKFAQAARRQLHEQVRARLEQALRTDSPELRAKARVVAELNKQIAQSSRQAVVEQVAYIWFNRFCALRYMDANHYTRLGVVSPAAGFTQPEILQEAKAGNIDPDLAPFVDSQRVFDLLSGRSPAANPQQEAYRLLLVASCNQYHAAMPFLFEPIDDYSELLMPDDLLSASSLLQQTREALTDDACQDVEVIGWLYQFYISEKKDEVIGAKKAITSGDIPAATQLFTPHWIVRYLVENSLGRLWLLHRPNSRLAEQMAFYIAPDADQTLRVSETLRVSKPEDLTICDPAVGSGHMLTYAFDLLYAMYEEEGYNPADIPRLILQKNLTGLEIDERAAALAAFALTMKARARDRRFFRRGVAPNIVTLRPIAFTEAELDAEVAALLEHVIPRSSEESSPSASAKDSSSKTPRNDRAEALREDLRADLRHDLALFREADNVGSLLRPRLNAAQLSQLHDRLSAPADTGQLSLFNEERRKKARQAIAQAIPLARLYDVVIANPPYMGSKNQNATLKKFLGDNYADVKADLFSAFTVRIMEMTRKVGFIGMMTPFVWMFLSSYEKMRQYLLDNATLTSLIRPEYHAFFDSAFVPICGFTLHNESQPEFKGAFIDLQEFYGTDVQPVKALEAIQNPDCGYFYRAAATDFKKIPGSPIAYSVTNRVKNIFDSNPLIENFAFPKQGSTIGNNDRFLRMWYEIGFPFNPKWKKTVKGGEFRKWFGNLLYVVNWGLDGEEIRDTGRATIRNSDFLFQPGLEWSRITSSSTSFRILQEDFFHESASGVAFPNRENRLDILGLLNTKISRYLLATLNPTLTSQSGDIARIPYVATNEQAIVKNLIKFARNDWDSYETSWDFTALPLLQAHQPDAPLAATYTTLRQQWQAATLEMQRLEEENNRIFITAYGLQDELTPEVPLSEITLTCNPHYRYNANKSNEELESLLLADTLREFISYAVGCMFGRYSLDKPGLILANQGETVADYLRKVQANVSFRGVFDEESSPSATTKDSSPGTARNDVIDGVSFPPDRDNAIPMLDGDWFSDDITERFKKFLRVTFGETHYEDNLAFIEAALGRDIRSYFLRDFYDHHVRTYKKRPIYWLFSSAKGSFNVLIYMHRYRSDTVSIVLNDYLREFRAKLSARKSHLEGVSVSAAATPRDKTQALKEVAAIQKTLQELRDYEDDILYPLATRQVQIDLDDGVKVNYNKFGKALKRVVGLSE
ncbi:MAG: BREX-1 system adenine-specific DNA-methyltransferase PglX [Chloroflexi bacterium]|nr:BREX-1 system adenine-specific DNA-methyltransferase PglX [Chloroflexota bacterium]